MNQIVIAIKKENILTYLTLFDNRPEFFTVFSETRLRDKELWDPGYTAKTDTIPKKTLTRRLFVWKRNTKKNIFHKRLWSGGPLKVSYFP